MAQYTVKAGDNLTKIAKQFGVQDYKTIKTKSGNPDLIFAGEVLDLPEAPPTPVAGQSPVVSKTPIEAPPMNSLTATGQNYLKVRQDAGLPADELSIKKLYRDRAFEEKYGEWRGTEAQYKSMWMQDITESANKLNEKAKYGEITDDQGNVLQKATQPPAGGGSPLTGGEVNSSYKYTPLSGDDYNQVMDGVIEKIGTTDLTKLISDFAGGDITTPELELTKEDRDAKLEEVKTAAGAALNTLQQGLAARGMTFSSIRSSAEEALAADTLAKESGINREFAAKIIGAARQESERRETALKTAETNYNNALEKMGYVYNPFTDTIEKTLSRENAERPKEQNYPASYDEWQLAGGLEGTGMTYNKWLDRNQKGEGTTYTEKDFYSSIDKGKTDLQQGEDWGNVWNRIKMQFPGVSDDIIDNALGISWRDDEAYQKWAQKKKGGESKVEFTLPDGTKVSI